MNIDKTISMLLFCLVFVQSLPPWYVSSGKTICWSYCLMQNSLSESHLYDDTSSYFFYSRITIDADFGSEQKFFKWNKPQCHLFIKKMFPFFTAWQKQNRWFRLKFQDLPLLAIQSLYEFRLTWTESKIQVDIHHPPVCLSVCI